MSDPDLDELRRIAELTRAKSLPISKRLLVELLDRIEALEAERDAWKANDKTLTEEWLKWKERGQRAEARLARVTDELTSTRFASRAHDRGGQAYSEGGGVEDVVGAVLAEINNTIRAVAADEQGG